MNIEKKVIDQVKSLRKQFSLSDFEALQIASSIVQTEVIADGLCLNSDGIPNGLEAIAMVLGFKHKQKDNILDAIKNCSQY